MTTDTQAETAAAEVGRARVRKEDARLVTGQTNWTDNTGPARHAAHGLRPQPVRARPDHPGGPVRRPRPCPAWWPRSPAPTSPPSRAACRAPGRSPRTSSSPTTRRWPPTRSATSARRWPASSPGAGTRPRTRRPPSTWTTSRCPPVLDIRTALDEDSPKVHEAGNKSYEFVAGQRRPGRRLPRRPGGDRAQLPAAAADPHRDGAAGRAVRAVRRRVHASGRPPRSRTCVRTMLALVTGIPEHEAAGHRARRRRRVRLQAAGHRRGGARPAGRPQGSASR